MATIGLFTIGYTALCAGEHFINNSLDSDFAIAAARLWAGISVAFGEYEGAMFTRNHYKNKEDRDERIKHTFD